MLFRSVIAALALTASVVKATPLALVSADVAVKFTVCSDVIVRLGPTFQDACTNGRPDDIVRGLVELHASLLDLSVHIDAGVGVWAHADIEAFVGLYVDLMVKIQVLLKIVVAGGQVDPSRSYLLALADPLKVVLSVFINAGIEVDAIIGAHVDLNLLVSVGISLGIGIGIQANVGVGLSL